MQSLETPEQFVGMDHVKTIAVVPDDINRTHARWVCLRRLPPEANLGAGLTRAELPGVTEQPFQHQPDQRQVAPGAQPRLNVYAAYPGRVFLPEIVHHDVSLRAEIDFLQAQLHTRQVGQRQQGIGQLAGLPDASLDAVDVVLQAFVFDCSLKQPAEAANRNKRLAQVVCNQVGKLLQIPV